MNNSILHDGSHIKQNSGTGTLCVILFCHNQAQYLAEHLQCTDSAGELIDQVIVVDIASNTPLDLPVLAHGKEDRPIRLIRHDRNIGIIAAMNHALAEVRADYVHFLAMDDFVAPAFYRAFHALASDHPEAGVFSTGYDNLSADGSESRRFRTVRPLARPGYLSPEAVRNALLRFDSWFAGHATIYRRDALQQTGGFDAALQGYSDAFAIFRIALDRGALFDPAPLATKRLHDGQFGRSIFIGPQAVRLLDLVTGKMAADPVFGGAGSQLLRRLRGRWSFNIATAASPPLDEGGGFRGVAFLLCALLRHKPFDALLVIRKRLSAAP